MSNARYFVRKAYIWGSAIALLARRAAFSQQYLVTITGTGTDNSGEALANGEVEVVSSDSNFTGVARTHEDGVHVVPFRLPALTRLR